MKLQTTLQVDLSRASDDRIPVVLSTDSPIEDGYSDYPTVLEHTSSAVDLSRAPLPLIEGHDSSRVNIGKVEGLLVEGGKLRGFLVLGTTARALELLGDIKAGIVRAVSIGARVLEKVFDEDVMRVTRWQPVELSLVAVPADPGTGLYRSHSMTDQTTATATSATPSRSDRNSEVAKLRRQNEILEIGIEFGVSDLAREAVEGNWPVERFKREAMDLYFERKEQALERGYPGDARHRPITSSALHPGGQPPIEEYSITRAIACATGDYKDNCLERELSADLERHRQNYRGGILIPIQRVVTKGGSGGNLVGVEHRPGDFISLLRTRTLAMQLGLVLDGLRQDISIPKNTVRATAAWIAADGSDSLTPSDPTFAAVTLSPKTVGAYTQVSRKMIIQSLPFAEAIVQQILAEDIGQAIDTAAFQGTGASNQPRGIFNQSGIGTVLPAAVGNPTFAEMIGLETDVAEANGLAMGGRFAYVCAPGVAQNLKVRTKDAGSGQFVWEGAKVNDYDAFMSSNIPTNRGVFGNFSELIIGVWESLEILRDPYTGIASGNVGIRVFADVDIAVRHAESFSVLTTA